VLDRVGEYLEAGVRLVWVIDPQKRRAVEYRSPTEAREIGSSGTLDGQDVLPGFSCVLEDILSEP
jgi:Uma2 family endonuclease